jgi:orotidine-5'-phosphate decarboxylase
MITSVRDRICLALDVDDEFKAIDLIAETCNWIGSYKIGLELFCSSGQKVFKAIDEIKMVSAPGSKIILDLKLHDTPTTVERTLRSLAKNYMFNYATVHIGDSPRSLKPIIKIANEYSISLFGVSVLTSVSGDDIADVYGGAGKILDYILEDRVISAAEHGLHGIVCSGLDLDMRLIKSSGDTISSWASKNKINLLVPGIRLPSSDPNDQKRVVTPNEAIEKGADIIVVGREVRDADNSAEVAEKIYNMVVEASNERVLNRSI